MPSSEIKISTEEDGWIACPDCGVEEGRPHMEARWDPRRRRWVLP